MRRRIFAAASALLLGALALGAPAASASAGPASPALGIKHVFVIVLENENYAASYETNPNPYLARTLRRQGTLLRQYYGTGHLSNDNYLAMMSGQAPNPETQSDCQRYVDFQPSPAVLDSDGQAIGDGCVYPANVLTLADQLSAKGLTWRGYMQSMGNDLSREPDRCGQPSSSFGTGMQDGTQSATATDQYAARHNPFVYFHSLIDSGACERNVLPLPHLTADLASSSTTPSLSFIVPDLCSDGHDAPCAGKDDLGSNAGGLTSVDHFLSVWVPKIQASQAYRDGGLIIVTTDEAQNSDTTACCGEKPGPNSPSPGITGPGGGRIGTLVVGRCVARNGVSDKPYNHYALLRSLEDLYGITAGGTDGKGHLGFAAAAGLQSFGPDVFGSCPTAARRPATTAVTTPRVTPTGESLPTTGGLPAAWPALAALGAAGALLLARRLRRPAHA